METRKISKLGTLLNQNVYVKIGEILFLFLVAFAIIKLSEPFVKDNLLLKQASVWIANVAMLLVVWLGIKLRGETCKDFGLTFKPLTFKQAFRVFLLSLLVLVIALAGFILGSIIMANITGIPEGSSDMSSYAYLKDNIGMLLLTLAGVYIVSSFGEEVIYRGFLINRISQIGMNTKKALWIAVILSSLIFGFVHYEWGPMGVGQTTFMGLALGICYLKLKKRLWILILAHAYMDTILMVQMYMASK
jgi:membrane protease YdiL (CAAX protease family)